MATVTAWKLLSRPRNQTGSSGLSAPEHVPLPGSEYTTPVCCKSDQVQSYTLNLGMSIVPFGQFFVTVGDSATFVFEQRHEGCSKLVQALSQKTQIHYLTQLAVNTLYFTFELLLISRQLTFLLCPGGCDARHL